MNLTVFAQPATSFFPTSHKMSSADCISTQSQLPKRQIPELGPLTEATTAIAASTAVEAPETRGTPRRKLDLELEPEPKQRKRTDDEKLKEGIKLILKDDHDLQLTGYSFPFFFVFSFSNL
jgi:hypothetical protein